MENVCQSNELFTTYDGINTKFGLKGPGFVHYVPTVIIWSKSIIIKELRITI